MRTLRITILLILGTILILFGMFEMTDIYGIIFDMKPDDHSTINTISYIMKFGVSSLCVTTAMLLPKSDALSLKDYKLLKTTFGFVLLADFLLVFLQAVLPKADADTINKIGIAVFMIVQTLLIIRHAEGFSLKVNHASNGKRIRLFQIISALLIYIPGFIAVLILKDKKPDMIIEIAVYALFVTTSTWMGLNVLTRDTFPKTNRHLIATGMMLFLCCDISVGIMTFAKSTVATALVYVFYAPALLLLAFSGYKKQPLSCGSQK